MASITTIQGSDIIKNSRADINNNFTNLNNDKIETSYLDTDTTLSANSDSKIATQKAVKTYVDTGGNVNASETSKGIVEEATDAEVTAGTATGATGAKLFVTPAKLSTRLGTTITDVTTNTDAIKHLVGNGNATTPQTYLNTQLPFILWTGSTNGAATTDFTNWVISDSTDVKILPLGVLAGFESTGSCHLYLSPFNDGTTRLFTLGTSGKTYILDFWAKFSGTGTSSAGAGFGADNGGGLASPFTELYTNSSNNRVQFCVSATGVLYASVSKAGTGVTNTDISSGITITNWNHYRIEFDTNSAARFYVNGTLKATITGTNIPTNTTNDMTVGFGRNDSYSYHVSAPNLGVKLS